MKNFTQTVTEKIEDQNEEFSRKLDEMKTKIVISIILNLNRELAML
jgi:hypothetical protein